MWVVGGTGTRQAVGGRTLWAGQVCDPTEEAEQSGPQDPQGRTACTRLCRSFRLCLFSVPAENPLLGANYTEFRDKQDVALTLWQMFLSLSALGRSVLAVYVEGLRGRALESNCLSLNLMVTTYYRVTVLLNPSVPPSTSVKWG